MRSQPSTCASKTSASSRGDAETRSISGQLTTMGTTIGTVSYMSPEQALGKPAMDALREIRNRIPLDIYGIDFNLLPDGRIVFFEANAAMHISMREREDLLETRMAMRNAYRRLFENPPPLPAVAKIAEAPQVSG